MRYLYLIAPFVLVVILGCSQRNAGPDIQIDLAISPSPPAVGPARVTLELRDAQNNPVEGATLKLEGNMSHAGMKPVFADATELEAGQYQANLDFTMAGDWFLVVEGTLANGQAFQKTIDVKGVRTK